VWIPQRSRNCNAHLERFDGSFKKDVADRMIFFGERHLQHSIDEFLEYSRREEPPRPRRKDYQCYEEYRLVRGKVAPDENDKAVCSILITEMLHDDSSIWTGRRLVKPVPYRHGAEQQHQPG